MRDEIQRLAGLVTDHLRPNTRPAERTVLTHITLLALEDVYLARDRSGHELAIPGYVIGVREVPKARPDQVFALVSQHPAVRVVDPQPAAIKGGDADPARGAVKGRAQELVRTPRARRDQPRVATQPRRLNP